MEHSAELSIVDDLVLEGTYQDRYLSFTLADEGYAVDAQSVQEIIGWNSATHIPNSPRHIIGVINIRGEIVPVVDLRLRFGFASAEYTKTTVVIVLRVPGPDGFRTVGLVVDAVSDVQNLAAVDISEVPEFCAVVEAQFINGLATVRDKMLIVINVDRLINEGVLGSIGVDTAKNSELDTSEPRV